jgi:hypothetical protein
MYFASRLRSIRNTILSLSENVNHIGCQLSLSLLVPAAIMALKALTLWIRKYTVYTIATSSPTLNFGQIDVTLLLPPLLIQLFAPPVTQIPQ